MATRASASTQISTLIDNLNSADATTREAAVARLTVIGARAVERLMAVAASASSAAAARAAALCALEGIADPRALSIALEALNDPDAAIAVTAASLAGVFVRGPKGAAAVDRLTEVALDGARPAPVRVAALRGLRDLAPSTLAPVLASLADDVSINVRTAASAGGGDAALDPLDVLTQSARESLSSDPQPLRQAIARAGQRAPLPILLRIIERVREHEGEQPAAQRPDWTAVRAAAHLALAQRGSRLAVYDLRESMAAASSPLPVEFLAALSTIGDASCVEAIAGAFGIARDQWWRDHLADAFRAIVKREKLTRRHAAIRKIEKKSKATLDALWPPRP